MVRVSRIPEILNVGADMLSCDHEIPTEWELPIRRFQSVVFLKGPVQIELFKTSFNRKLLTFGSVFGYPEAMAVDVFTVDWNLLD